MDRALLLHLDDLAAQVVEAGRGTGLGALDARCDALEAFGIVLADHWVDEIREALWRDVCAQEAESASWARLRRAVQRISPKEMRHAKRQF